MALVPISQLIDGTGVTLTTSDIFAFTDVSDLAQGVNGTTKKGDFQQIVDIVSSELGIPSFNIAGAVTGQTLYYDGADFANTSTLFVDDGNERVAIGGGVLPTADLHVFGNNNDASALFLLENLAGNEKFRVTANGTVSINDNTNTLFGLSIRTPGAGFDPFRIQNIAGTEDIMTVTDEGNVIINNTAPIFTESFLSVWGGFSVDRYTNGEAAVATASVSIRTGSNDYAIAITELGGTATFRLGFLGNQPRYDAFNSDHIFQRTSVDVMRIKSDRLDFPAAAYVSGSAGAASGNYLQVTANGTAYKIELLNNV
jgi:hypothetical protein